MREEEAERGRDVQLLLSVGFSLSCRPGDSPSTQELLCFSAKTALNGKIVAGVNFVFLIFRLLFSTYPGQFGCPWRVCIGLIYDTISSDKSHLRGLNEASGQGQRRQGGGGRGGQM